MWQVRPYTMYHIAVIILTCVFGEIEQAGRQGEWVHTHNVKSHLDEAQIYEYTPDYPETKIESGATFQGYKRKYGRAGIRNEIYIIPTVGCVNDVCRRLEKLAQKYVRGSIDGIFALTHQFGCSQLGEDQKNIKKLLCAIALNPNASFVLFVGLGCENNGLDGIKEYLKPFGRENIAYYNCQEVSDELSYGLEIIEKFSEILHSFYVRARKDHFRYVCVAQLVRCYREVD